MVETDELRRLLDERGVEWRRWTKKGKRGFTSTETIWFVPYSLIGSDEPGGFFARASSSGRHIYLISIVASPEQAIAATLGAGECEMEYGGDITPDTAKAMGVYFCSECGSPIYNDCMPYFCGYCGKAVKR